MNELYPIVRRVRRPLIGERQPTVVLDTVEPVKQVDEVAPESATPANADEETVAE